MVKRSLVLITRPAQDAQIYSNALSGEGFNVLLSPMLEIVPKSFDIPDLSKYQALLVTSANALRVLAPLVRQRDIKLYVVGENTKEEALALGFTDVVSSGGAARDLAVLVREEANKDGLPLLHIHGEDIAKSVAQILDLYGFNVEDLIVYKAKRVNAFSSEVLDKIRDGSIEVVTFFSKRTAKNFMRLIDENELSGALGGIKALCISSGVLECVQLRGWAKTYMAKTPDRKGMQALLEDVCS